MRSTRRRRSIPTRSTRSPSDRFYRPDQLPGGRVGRAAPDAPGQALLPFTEPPPSHPVARSCDHEEEDSGVHLRRDRAQRTFRTPPCPNGPDGTTCSRGLAKDPRRRDAWMGSSQPHGRRLNAAVAPSQSKFSPQQQGIAKGDTQ